MAAIETLVDTPLVVAPLDLPASLVEASTTGVARLVRGAQPGPVILLVEVAVWTQAAG